MEVLDGNIFHLTDSDMESSDNRYIQLGTNKNEDKKEEEDNSNLETKRKTN